jgi:hypothetical protein
MANCFTLRADPGDPNYSPYTLYFCGTNAELRPADDVPGRVRLFIDGQNAWGQGYGNTVASGTISQGKLPVVAPYTRGPFGSCDSCPDAKYDCINGQCVDAEQYKTPGLFESLDLCRSRCSLASGNQPPCDGQCITNDEYAQIQSAIAQKQRDCG